MDTGFELGPDGHACLDFTGHFIWLDGQCELVRNVGRVQSTFVETTFVHSADRGDFLCSIGTRYDDCFLHAVRGNAFCLLRLSIKGVAI